MMAGKTKLKPKSKRECLISLLWVCCALLTMAAFTFAMYTSKEFASLKVRIIELENQLMLIRKSNMGYTRKDYMEDIRNLKSNKVRILPTSNEVKKSFHGTPLLSSETINREAQKPINRSNVCMHLSGGRTDNGANATDRNVIKHWVVSHSTDHVTYNARDGCIQIVVPGYYYIYSQIQLIFKKWEKATLRHETLVNSKRVLSGIYKHGKQNGANFEANYQGGVFKLQNGDRILIRGNNKRGWLQKESNYFGTFLVAATAF